MKTYKLCVSQNFSEHVFSTKPMMLNRQMSMDGVEPPPLTTLFKEKSAEDGAPPFDHYFIEHEKTEQAPGRTGNMNFQHYIHRYAIYAYHNQKNGLLLMSGRKKAITDLIRNGGLTLKMNPLYIDLNKVQEAVEKVHMVWFRFYDGQFSSTAFHGENIKTMFQQQDLFRRGRISTLSFSVRFDGRIHPLLLSHDGTVVLQQGYEDAVEELSLLAHLFDLYLKPTISRENLMSQQPRWKEEILEEFEEGFDPYEMVESPLSP